MKRIITVVTVLLSILPSCTKDEDKGIQSIKGITISSQGQHGSISSIAEDQSGTIWFGTRGNGLFRYDGSSYIRYAHDRSGISVLSDHINSVIVDSDGLTWIGTQKGVNVLDSRTGEMSTPRINDLNNYVTGVFESRTGRILITTQAGLHAYDRTSGSFNKIIPFKESSFVSFHETEDGAIWVIYNTFIDHYDSSYSHLETYKLPNSVYSSVYDGSGRFYLRGSKRVICFDTARKRLVELPAELRALDPERISMMTGFGEESMLIVEKGVHYCYNFYSDELIPEDSSVFPYDIPYDDFRPSFIYKGKSGSVWAATNDGGIISLKPSSSDPYDLLLKKFPDFSPRSIHSDGRTLLFVNGGNRLVSYDLVNGEIRTERIHDILGDEDESIFYGLYWNHQYNKVFIYSLKAVFEITPDKEGRFRHIHTYTADSIYTITSLTVDGKGNLWVGCMDNSNLYFAPTDLDSKHVGLTKLAFNPEGSRIYTTALTTMRSGDVLVAYTDIGLAIVSSGTQNIRFVKLSDKYKQMYIDALCEDRDGNIWAGTSDVGLFVYDPSAGSVVMPEQFEEKYISSIVNDSEGHVLVSTGPAIYSFDAGKKTFIPIWISGDDVSNSRIHMYSFNDGHVLISAGHKFSSMDIASINHQSVPKSFSVCLSDNNSNVIRFIDSSEFADGKVRIRLPQNQNNIELSVFTPNFIDGQLVYGIDARDITNGINPSLNIPRFPLFNLKYGRQRVDMSITNIDNSANSDVESLVLFIKRPWFISTAALVFMSLLLLALLITIMQLIVKVKEKKLEAEHIQMEKDLQAKMDEDNIDFFANMSHELRTPLTIISGAISTMSKEEGVPASQLKLQNIIQRNSDRMLRLISQMLDFNKLEHNKLPLEVSETDVDAMIEDVVDMFTIGADQKEITLSINGPEEEIKSWLDADKFEKIMCNLLSNALKFTPFKGSITVRYRLESDIFPIFPGKASGSKGNYLVVDVADSGIGIPQDSLDIIFERFGQAFPSQKNGGTGIGLYFAKSMIELHHGFIKVTNNNGAVFTFALPVDRDAYSDYERAAKNDQRKSIDRNLYLSEYTMHQDSTPAKSDTTILVIDDDYEITYFLKSLLSPHYKVLSSFDAMGGYKLIESEEPDIIISDIMMLDMDGLQLCKMVKDNIDMCHIPFILLTAKDTVQNQIEGLKSGADAYIIKPFDPDYLLAMIESQLRNRENARKIVGNSTKVEETVEETISAKDKRFLEKLYQLFEDNLSNNEINAADFADVCGISRTKFFYKVKSLTGMTPSDYFRTYRLNRAAELLKEDKYKIAGIAEICGFSSPSHFSSSFKKQFGMLPSEYINQ